jgi:hypothetical protein
VAATGVGFMGHWAIRIGKGGASYHSQTGRVHQRPVTGKVSEEILLIKNRFPEMSSRILMKIDIDRLTEAELIDLNHRIVARLRFLNQMQAHSDMLEFKIGDRVTFTPPGLEQVQGMLTRYNRKTVTIIADNGRQWNVSPHFLSKVVPSAESTGGSNLVLLGKRQHVPDRSRQ